MRRGINARAHNKNWIYIIRRGIKKTDTYEGDG